MCSTSQHHFFKIYNKKKERKLNKAKRETNFKE